MPRLDFGFSSLGKKSAQHFRMYENLFLSLSDLTLCLYIISFQNDLICFLPIVFVKLQNKKGQLSRQFQTNDRKLQFREGK